MGLGLLSSAARAADSDCGDWAAVINSIEGDVDYKHTAQVAWTVARVGAEICMGGSIRTGPFSRVEVSLPGETEARSFEDTEFTFSEPEDDSFILIRIINGLMHFMSRNPRALTTTTPYANAGLEGTEFLERVADDATGVAVFEGTVHVDGQTGSLDVHPRQRVSVNASGVGQARGNEQERDDLLWSLHYPRVLDGELPRPDAAAPAGAGRAAFLAARAQGQLLVGRIEGAQADIAAALAVDADHPEALAIAAMVALARGRPDEAHERLDTALARDPDSAAALTAESYLLARGDERRRALDVMRRAAARHPENALVQARLAEVSLAVDAVRESLSAAERALSLNPLLASPFAMRGFAALKSGELESAREAFSEAIRLDSADGLPRIGLAIILARVGQAVQARDQLEIAVILEANDSVFRGYLGKAYLDEARRELAGRLFNRAESLDANDPTGLVYDARLKFDENLPIAALKDLGTAAAANGDEPTFRSGLHFDEDLTTRSAGAGMIYRGARREESAMRAGWASIVSNPLDFSGYRLLSDVSSEFPRSQLFRVNEAFQARQMQPQHVLPDPPQMAEANPFILDTAGPAPLAHPVSRSSFVRNGIFYQASATSGSNGSIGDHFVVSSIGDRVSVDLGQYHFGTDGFRSNNDFDFSVWSLFLQGRPSSDTSLQMDLRSTRTVKGDPQLRFFADDFDPSRRQHEDVDSVRFGASHRLGPWTTIVGTFLLDRADVSVTVPSLLSAGVKGDTGIAEMAIYHEEPRWNYVGGVRVNRGNVVRSTTYAVPLPGAPGLADFRTRHVQGYLYANGRITDSLLLTLGASLDNLHGQAFRGSRSNGKLGLAFRPAEKTELRIGLFQTLTGPAISRLLIHPSLEPMQVAAFGQYYDGDEGEFARNYAFGVDHDLTPVLHLGAEHLERKVVTPFLLVPPGTTNYVVNYLHDRESLDSAYLYWSRSSRVGLKFGWQSEDFDYHGVVSPYGFSYLHTTRVPVQAKFFVGNALSLSLTSTHIRQKGVFGFIFPAPGRAAGQDQFWILDAAVDYRLPGRHGSVDLGIRNLLDEEFRFQDTDPENPRIFPDRFVSLRISLNF